MYTTDDRKKAIRLVDFLARIASLRTKTVRDIEDYEHRLWISDIPDESGCFARAWGREEEREPDEWLEIQNRKEPELPEPPQICKEWIIQASLRDKKGGPGLLSEVSREQVKENRTDYVIDHLRNHKDVQSSWERYKNEKWRQWVAKHDTWERMHKIYSSLFAIQQDQLRLGEEYELVLGVGLLSWLTPFGHRVRRHLLVADVILEFESRLGRFTVKPHPEGAKLRLELDMLDIEEQPPRVAERIKDDLEQAGDDPWDKGCVNGILKSIAHSISPNGEYKDTLRTESLPASSKPIIEYLPALILRKRSAKGLTDALRKIREQIENDGVIPAEFADLAEINTSDFKNTGSILDKDTQEFEGEVFFPKLANEEQRHIAEKLKSASGVIVQGPPGTGKSHTIANLVCHLLATGQRTLITAKTPRALQVLENLIPEELRPLCVNLLGSGLEEQRSLESSVRGILRKKDEWNIGKATQEKSEIEKHLRDLREEKVKANRRLRDIRESETCCHSIAEGAYKGTSARIAEAVNSDKEHYYWFADEIPHDMQCKFSSTWMIELLSGIRYFENERRLELEQLIPDVLPLVQSFAESVRQEADASSEEENSFTGADERIADLMSLCKPFSLTALHHALTEFLGTCRRLVALPYSWSSCAIRDVISGKSAPWQMLHKITQDAILSSEGLLQIAEGTEITHSYTTDLRVLFEDACKLKSHFLNGGSLGWWVFKPKAVKECSDFIKTVRINGQSCTDLEKLSKLCSTLLVRINIEKVWQAWAGRSERSQGNLSIQLTELKAMSAALEKILSIEADLDKCKNAIRDCPNIIEPAYADESQVECYLASCCLAQARRKKALATKELRKIEASILPYAHMQNAHPYTKELLKMVKSRDVGGYAQIAGKIQSLEDERRRLRMIEQRISELKAVLPKLAESLMVSNDCRDWDERLDRIVEAWHWAQAYSWINDHIRKEDAPALAVRIRQIENRINELTAKLASIHAWTYCFSRLKTEHRRHMEAWQQSIKRLGKGTGKYAPRHRREAQQHLHQCREAVPAWVMPLHRIWDTVDPSPCIFDVIIVDEASQCGLEALPLMYLGKKILIVGDDKQISPDAVGVSREAMLKLMEEYLHDFQYKSVFDVESSMFDHGKLRYDDNSVTLREHFRCMPEIIRFSNALCYSDTPLIPLRQYGKDRLPPLEHVYIANGYREGHNHRVINRPEAEAIVNRIVEMCRDRRYDSKTMGVVVLQGEAQAALIQDQLFGQLGDEERERRRLVCGNPYSFQGDERDIILLSMVAATNERIGPYSDASYVRRFNVAASRARDQMILFHSVRRDDLSAKDLRRRLLEFFESPIVRNIGGIDKDTLEKRALRDNRMIINPPVPFDSWFEVDVALEISRKGFEVIPQYEVAGRFIDLVIEGGQARLAVECDGDKWHGPEQYEDDMQRQRQLERCGWSFFRVRESAFYIDRQRALSSLWGVLDEMGISSLPPFTIKQERVDDSVSEPDHDEKSPVDDFDEIEEDPSDDVTPNLFDRDEAVKNSRLNEVTPQHIRSAIITVLQNTPNSTCTTHSITARVLKELKIVTRSGPRKNFEIRVMNELSALENQRVIEKYKSKNNRIRLL